MQSSEKSEKKGNVLIVHNYYQIPGGEDTVVASESEMLREHGHKVVLYTRNNSELKEMGKFQKLLLPINTIFNFKTYRDIRRLITEEKIDIVHVHNTLNLISPSVYYAARSKKVPVVQTIHNFRLICPGATLYRDGHICEECLDKGLHCAVKHRCYRGSRIQTLACVISTRIHRLNRIYGKINYICLTEFNREKLLTLKQIKPERVFIKPNSIKASGLAMYPAERKNQIVYAGRLDKLKGIDVLLEAWRIRQEKGRAETDAKDRGTKETGTGVGTDKQLKLVIYGSGPEEEKLKRFAEEKQLSNIEFMGQTENSTVKKAIAESLAIVLPTRWYEGFPMSIIEAFSVGTPVICTDIGNTGSIVQNGITGYKFPDGDALELAGAIDKLLGDQEIFRRTKEEFDKRYGMEGNYEQLVGIYRSAI